MLVFSPPRLFQKLPDTMKMAKLFRDILEPLLDVADPTWSYGDRVLSWLAPCFQPDLARFYNNAGANMEEMFDSVGLEHLDRDFSMLLYRKIKELNGRRNVTKAMETPDIFASHVCFLLPD